jgi:large subunit ribosomal protein L7/L12
LVAIAQNRQQSNPRPLFLPPPSDGKSYLMNQLDKVAQTIYTTFKRDVQMLIGYEKWEAIPEWEKDEYRQIARAAIDAMEPSAAVVPSNIPPEDPIARRDKFEFEVILTSCGPSKINAIKNIREICHNGLKEAKEMVESIPVLVRGNLCREEARNISAKLRAIGCEVKVQ